MNEALTGKAVTMDPLQDIHLPIGYALERHREMLREAQNERLLQGASANSSKEGRRLWVVLTFLVPALALVVVFIAQH
jgi:hypothetical protein